jgi:hypothetical protein
MPDTMMFMTSIHEGIRSLLVVRLPIFLAFSYQIFLVFAAIRVWNYGLRVMTSGGGKDVEHEGYALGLELLIGYTMVVCYEAPIPGIGISFSNLYTDSISDFARWLDAGALKQSNEHLNAIFARFWEPDSWSLTASLMYLVLFGAYIFAQVASILAIAGSFIAAAACGLLGPLFVPFYILPPYRWLFDGWQKMFIGSAMVEVVALAFLMIFEKMIFGFQTTLPDIITEDMYPLYIVKAFVVLAAFGYEMMQVRHFTAGLMSGHSGGGSAAGMVSLLMGKR